MPYPPGTVLLLDNCSIHKKMNEVFEAKGFIPLYLSPYSPMFQPVELAFSKAKTEFRSMWPWDSSIETSIVQVVDNITSDDVQGFFREAKRQIAHQIPIGLR